MRTIDVLVASALLGVALGILFDGPKTRPSGDPLQASATSASRFCENMTWLRAPLMRSASAGN